MTSDLARLRRKLKIISSLSSYTDERLLKIGIKDRYRIPGRARALAGDTSLRLPELKR